MKSTSRGFTIIEMMVASALIALLVTMSAQMLSSAAIHRRAAERRTVALEEAANVTESVGSLPYEEITPERVAQYRLSEPAQNILGAGTLKIALEPSVSGPPSKLVRVEVTWPNVASGGDAAAQLSSWVFAPGKAAP